MVEAYLRRSPLAHRGLAARATADMADADIILGERSHRCLRLRGDVDVQQLALPVHAVASPPP